jgi:hypothetical protein
MMIVVLVEFCVQLQQSVSLFSMFARKIILPNRGPTLPSYFG